VLHENILFYQRFGIRLRSDFAETADHLLGQLSFLVHLLILLQYREEANQEEEGAQIVQALGDYSDRHLRSWIPAAVAAAEDVPFQASRAILALVSHLVTQCSSLRDN
jgi:TorA maturation chaperone TorD